MKNPILAQQQSLSNQEVQRMLRSKVIQAKLTISEPRGQFEREADRVADAVMRVPDLDFTKGVAVSEQAQGVRIQRMCSECEEELHRQPLKEEEGTVLGQTPRVQSMCSECEEELRQQPMIEEEEILQTKETSGKTAQLTPDIEASVKALRGRGQPLPHSVRAFFEPRFGHDFSRVRVHTDARAGESARKVNALAYTVGHDIVFGAGQYRSDHPAGVYLLAHELTHVLQAKAAGQLSNFQAHLDEPSGRRVQNVSTSTNSAAESQAWRMAQTIMLGARVSEALIPTPGAQLAPQSGAMGSIASLPPKQPERSRGVFAQSGAMEKLVEKWHSAGLLDSPFRPDDVPPISPVPHPGEIAVDLSPEALAEEAAALGMLMGGPGVERVPGFQLPPGLLPGPPGGAPSPRPSTPIGTPVETPAPGPGTGLGSGYKPRPPGGGLNWRLAIALALAPFIASWLLKSKYPELDWQGKTSPITGQPVENVEEYLWLQDLTDAQREYLKMLYDAQSLHPDLASEEPDPLVKPATVIQAAISAAWQAERQVEEQEVEQRKRKCVHIRVPRLGGDPRHDEYAMKVSRDPLNMDYYVGGGRLIPYGINYDALTPGSNLVWEVKTGYGFLFNPSYAALARLAQWELQKDIGLFVAKACNLQLKWSIGARNPDNMNEVNTAKALARIMNRVWNGNPPVLSLPG
jgi:hypothetical protein